jgi:hypothetical protein
MKKEEVTKEISGKEETRRKYRKKEIDKNSWWSLKMFWKFSMIPFFFVACRLKAGIMEPEETSITRQRLGKYFPAATNT